MPETYSETKTIQIQYDDGTLTPWTTTFRTHSPTYRTASGEVFFVPNVEGHNLLIVKMLGDYNEVGDFAVPILMRLGLHAKDAILIHDDLSAAQGDIQIWSGQPNVHTGNNAIFSLNRSLTYLMADRVSTLLRDSRFGAEPLPSQIQVKIKDLLVEIASIRDKNHLGHPSAIHRAAKNRTAILTPLRKILADHAKAVIKEGTANLVAESGDGAKEISAIKGRLRQPQSMTQAEKDALEARVVELQKTRGEKQRLIKDYEAERAEELEQLMITIAKIVDEELSYERLMIGVAPSDPSFGDSGFADFVLSPFPRDVFGPALWDRALETLRVHLRNQQMP